MAFQEILFTCGVQIQDLDLPGWFNNVYTQKFLCGEPIEKLYYIKCLSICIIAPLKSWLSIKTIIHNVLTVVTSIYQNNS